MPTQLIFATSLKPLSSESVTLLHVLRLANVFNTSCYSIYFLPSFRPFTGRFRGEHLLAAHHDPRSGRRVGACEELEHWHVLFYCPHHASSVSTIFHCGRFQRSSITNALDQPKACLEQMDLDKEDVRRFHITPMPLPRNTQVEAHLRDKAHPTMHVFSFSLEMAISESLSNRSRYHMQHSYSPGPKRLITATGAGPPSRGFVCPQYAMT